MKVHWQFDLAAYFLQTVIHSTFSAGCTSLFFSCSAGPSFLSNRRTFSRPKSLYRLFNDFLVVTVVWHKYNLFIRYILKFANCICYWVLWENVDMISLHLLFIKRYIFIHMLSFSEQGFLQLFRSSYCCRLYSWCCLINSRVTAFKCSILFVWLQRLLPMSRCFRGNIFPTY